MFQSQSLPINSQFSSNLVASQPVIPPINDHQKPRKNTIPAVAEKQLITKLKNTQIDANGNEFIILTEASSQQPFLTECINKLSNTETLNFVYIAPNSILQQRKWLFSFDLFIGPYNIDDQKHDTYYYHEFKADYKVFTCLHSTVISEIFLGYKYFSNNKYPKPKNNTKIARGKVLNDKMKQEEQCIVLPKLPKGPRFLHKKADENDLNEFVKYLNNIFASPYLMLQDFIYIVLNFNKDLISLLKYKAKNKLKMLFDSDDAMFCVQCKNKNQIKNANCTKYHDCDTIYSIKRKLTPFKDPNDWVPWLIKAGRNYHSLIAEFYVIHKDGYATVRLLKANNNGNVNVINKLKFQFHSIYITERSTVGLAHHWALKLESNDYLMTAEYFNDKGGLCRIKIYPNTVKNRRVFWYFWNGKDDVTDAYTKRWNILHKLSAITNKYYNGELIIKRIEDWCTDKQHKYETTTCNCQHFVRDIMAGIDIDAASTLNSALETKLFIASVAPIVVSTAIEEEIRMNEQNIIAVNQFKSYFDPQQKKDNKMGAKMKEIDQLISHIRNSLDDDNKDDVKDDCDGTQIFLLLEYIKQQKGSVQNMIALWRTETIDELSVKCRINDRDFIQKIVNILKKYLTRQEEDELYQTYKQSPTKALKILWDQYKYDNNASDMLASKFEDRKQDESKIGII